MSTSKTPIQTPVTTQRPMGYPPRWERSAIALLVRANGNKRSNVDGQL